MNLLHYIAAGAAAGVAAGAGTAVGFSHIVAMVCAAIAFFAVLGIFQQPKK